MTEKMTVLQIALAQLNPTVGDVPGNLALAVHAHSQAQSANADLIVFPELFLSGYPPEDLVLKSAFVTACEQALTELAMVTGEEGAPAGKSAAAQ